MDDEFFGFLATRGHFRSACRFCEAARTRVYRARMRLKASVRRARRRRRQVVAARPAVWKEAQKLAA